MDDMTGSILDRMTTILVESQTLAHQLEDAAALSTSDREVLLRATSRISATADGILGWLLEAPLQTKAN
jgi:hypothetical protein